MHLDAKRYYNNQMTAIIGAMARRKDAYGRAHCRPCVYCGQPPEAHIDDKCVGAKTTNQRPRYKPQVALKELMRDKEYLALRLKKKHLISAVEKRFKVKAEYKNDKLIFTNILQPVQQQPHIDAYRLTQTRDIDAYAWRNPGIL